MPEETIIRFSKFAAPFGEMFIALSSSGVCRVDMRIDENSFVKDLEEKYKGKVVRDEKSVSGLISQMKEYLRGVRKAFTCNVHFMEGTEFQRRVWKKLMEIPYGETRSYKWLAEEVGNPKAFRAVGTANSRNPIAIIVPCHRVINENGNLGGYSGGIDIKKRLLDLERFHLTRASLNRDAAISSPGEP